MKSLSSIVLVAGWMVASCALAQHEHHPSPAPSPTPSETPETPASPEPQSPPAHHHAGAAAPPEEPPDDRNLFQSDMSLMTGMVPRDPAAGMAGMTGWHLMDMGVARLSFNRQGGPSGASRLESSNWNMVHAGKSIGPGRLSLMMMNSLEPATFAKQGSPELFQTGESYRGRPLVDRQHPHDFFMNLSATYRLDLGPDGGAWIQVAPVGEPSLGPTAFMHRASAGENPTAPIGHHWEDSTHIAENVVTVGGGWKWFALEGSAFRGREPDERRWDIDGGRIDSASIRASLFLGGDWSGQVSHGYLRRPEALVPGNTHRTTASLQYGAAGDRPLAFAVIWGRNAESHGTSDAWLVEAAWQATSSDQVYGRAELVEKDREILETKRISPGHDGEEDLVRIGAFTAGYVRELPRLAGLKTGLGADVTAYGVPSSLKRVYGSFPLSVHVFVRLRWGAPHATGHAGHAASMTGG